MKKLLATKRDIDAIIAGIYENEAEEDGADIATDEDIDNIIAGTFKEGTRKNGVSLVR